MRKGVLSAFVAGLAALVAMLAVLPAAALAVEFGADPSEGPAGLPNGRVYEEVSPPVKYGGEAGYSAGAKKLQVSPLYSVASPSGESVLFTENGAFGETSSGLDLFGVATRSPGGGWTTKAAIPPVASEPNGVTDLPYYFDPAQNLKRFAFTSGKPYVSGANAQSEAGVDQSKSPNLYLTAESGASQQSGGVEPSWISRPLAPTAAPALGAMPGEDGISIAGASPNLARVYFAYTGTLTKEDEPRAAHLATHAYGFYEWAGGQLHEAGVLPDGQLDEYGASPVAVEAGISGSAAVPAEFAHEVSASGETAFFISPSPGFGYGNPAACEAAGYTGPGGCVPEIYARIHEGATTRVVLVSRNELTHEPAPEPSRFGMGFESTRGYAYAAPDGSRIFFADSAPLTAAAKTAEEAGTAPTYKVYEDNLVARGGEGEVVYRPALILPSRTGQNGEILALSVSGDAALIAHPASGEAYDIQYWSLNSEGAESVTTIAEAPTLPRVESARMTANGAVAVFATNAPLTAPAGATGTVTEFNKPGEFNEVYRYTPGAGGGTLNCISCNGMQAATGNAILSNDDNGVDRRHLATTRAMNAEGTEVFFDTPEALVHSDVNHTRDVYEWQAPGTGACAAADTGGCVYLISAGTSPRESFLLDNSENGENVFFATTSALAPEDTEGGYDVYDARVSTGTPVVGGTTPCGSHCQGQEAPVGLPQLLTSAVGASGNLLAQAGQTQQKKGSAKKGVGKRNEVRKRKLARCRKHAHRRPNRHKRKRALERCRRRFGAKAARRHRGRHHARGRRQRHGHGNRRRG